MRRFDAAGLPSRLIERELRYSEAAPCVVANVADTTGALLSGHSVFKQGQGDYGNYSNGWSYYDDQGQFFALCGPCKTGLPGDCMSCSR